MSCGGSICQLSSGSSQEAVLKTAEKEIKREWFCSKGTAQPEDSFKQSKFVFLRERGGGKTASLPFWATRFVTGIGSLVLG